VEGKRGIYVGAKGWKPGPAFLSAKRKKIVVEKLAWKVLITVSNNKSYNYE
jgi:hypothetical protein